MADEKKTSPKAEKKPEAAKAEPAKTEPAKAKPAAEVKNGKGDAPRNCFSDTYRSNFDGIDWGK